MTDGPRTRREVLVAAVAAGGASGLAACTSLTDDRSVPTGVEDPSTLDRRQHAWNDGLETDDHGNHRLPRHHVFQYLDLRRDGPPTADDRAQVREALAALERAYERSSDGLLFSVAYAPSYFRRYGEAPAGVDLPPPRRLSPFEEPTFDTQDALLHLAADRPGVLLEAEAALLDDGETVNGREAVSFDDVFVSDDRRTGFVGPGMPAERAAEVDGIPDDAAVPEAAPLFMGFEAGFAGNQAGEAAVTLRSGPFAGGTTKHVSKLHQRLDRWYGENDHDDMVARLFGPDRVGHVEGVGDGLGDHSGVAAPSLEELVATAREASVVGHAEKVARANRDDEGRPRTLRRHVESTDDGVAGLHFPSLQREISTFEAVREAMNGADVAAETPAVRQRVNNGILRYVFVKHRGNFLVPPRAARSLPTPDGETPT